MRSLAAAFAVVFFISGCSSDPVEQYLDRVAEITATMRADSIAALPDPTAPSLEAVAAVNSARREAAAELERLAPPSEMRPEHTALLLAVSDLASAGEDFVASTTDLDGAEFSEAIRGATAIDETAMRVSVACDALRHRASELGYVPEVRC